MMDDRSRNMLMVSMCNPDRWCVRVVYTSQDMKTTDRIISPIKYNACGHLVAMCCGRGDVRQFDLKSMQVVELVSSNEVLAPGAIVEL